MIGPVSHSLALLQLCQALHIEHAEGGLCAAIDGPHHVQGSWRMSEAW